MKVLLIPDKFKGSLTAREVIESITAGIQNVYPEAEIHSVTASDGGDGFLDSIIENLSCEVIACETVDALGRVIDSEYLYNSEDKTAYIELAKASGLVILKESERDAMRTSTLGTGLQIKHAIQKGATAIYVGIGGSATNDAGLGIAVALGHYFLDEEGNQLAPIGRNLSRVKSIHKKRNAINLKGISFFAVNDVDNPLYGIDGAARTYAWQKGANIKEIKELDCGMKDFANLVQLQTKKDVAELSGSGAAGGTAYGLKVFCDAKFISGTDFLFEVSKIEKLLTDYNFDLIITGEGKIDNQTLHGKLIKGIMDLGIRFDIKVLALCGKLDLEEITLKNPDNTTIIEIADPTKSLRYNMNNAGELLFKTLVEYLNK